MEEYKINRTDDITISRVEYDTLMNQVLKYRLIKEKIISEIFKSDMSAYQDSLYLQFGELNNLIEILFNNEINERLYILKDIKSTELNGEEK